MREAPDKPDGKRWGGRGAMIAFAILAAYPLSMGPVYFHLFRRHAISPQTWSALYKPIGWVTDSYEPLRALLTWYLGLWGYGK